MQRPFLATYEVYPFAIQGSSTITRTLEDTDCDDLGATITETLEDTDNDVVSFLYATVTDSLEDTDCDNSIL